MPGDEVTDRQHRPGRRRAGTRKKIVFALVVTTFFFLALELLLALAGVSPLIDQQDPLVGFAESLPLFVENESNPAELATATNKLAYFNPQSFPAIKETGTRRVFCLGGSTTFGRPYDDSTSFAGWLREFLPLADPAHRWEVINAGGVSYASYRVAAVSEQLLGLEPDLVIIYTGHNEFLEDVTFPDWKDRSWLLEKTTLLAARSRIFTILYKGLRPSSDSHQQAALPAEVDEILNHTVGPSSYERDDLRRDQVIALFQFNLRRMIRLARQHDIAVLLVTPASNLKDFSPLKSQHRDGLTDQDQRRWQELVDQARGMAIGQQWAEAVVYLGQAVAIDDRHADGHFQLATALLAEENYAQALVHYRRAREEDICPLRSLAPLVESVREVARMESVPLVDFEHLLAEKCRERNGHAIPGNDFFLDHVHPTIESHRMLAEEIIRQLESGGWWHPGQQWNKANRDQVSRRLLGAINQADHARARRNLAKVLNWSGKHMEAGVLAVSVLEELPEDPEALSIAAAYMRQLGRLEPAIEYLSRRVTLTPDEIDSRRRLASLLVEARRLEEALLHQRRVVEIQPSNAQGFHHLGIILAELNRFDEAISSYHSAIQLDKNDAAIHYHLGIALAGSGDLERSRDSFQAARTLSPEDSDVAYNLAMIHGLLGKQLEMSDPEGARKHYQSALELQPGMPDIQDRLEKLMTVP
jgi:tetratricopeptide (TPR) repeat protein